MLNFYKKENFLRISKRKEKDGYYLTVCYRDYIDTPLGDSIEFENSYDFHLDNKSDLNFAYDYMKRKVI